MRLAWFSPWPPDPSGVAGRSADVVPVLAARGHGIDVFVDESRVPTEGRQPASPPAAGRVRVLGAHDFVWREAARSYDLVVYQVGNSHLHEYIWPYLFRWPGLAVLHDGRLHHARALALLSRGRAADYRAEFAWSHPDVSPHGAELTLGGLNGAYIYQWPMLRGVLESSRLSATHARGAIAEIQRSSPGRAIDHIALGEGLETPVAEDVWRGRRRAAGIPDTAVVFGVFGGLTFEKRVPQILAAFAVTHARTPETRLVLAGTPDADLDLTRRIHALGLTDATDVLGRLDAAAFDEWIAAVDVSLNLRWPSALETSGPWVRALAAARPTVIVDLEHLVPVPTLDPRTWEIPAPGAPGADSAIAVSIDILDEDHSLLLAMRRLATDAGLRAKLGRAARMYWETEHTVARMADDYERVMARARALPPPDGDRPAHLAPDVFAYSRELLAAFGPEAMSRVRL